MNNQGYLQHGSGAGPFMTERVEIKTKPLWWQERGLSYTATGYGSKIPTTYMAKHAGKWKRVYCRVFSNSGTCYIVSAGEKITIDI